MPHSLHKGDVNGYVSSWRGAASFFVIFVRTSSSPIPEITLPS